MHTFLAWLGKICIVWISLGLGVALMAWMASGVADKPWKTHCKYCHRKGHYFKQCDKFTDKQKDALEVLANEETGW